MRAVVYHGPSDMRLEDVSEPEAGPGELKVQVATVGICGTDASEFVHGPQFFPLDSPHPHSGHHGPTIPGHEFSGWVTAVGDGVTGFAEGDLVATGAGVSCGVCPSCLAGNTNLCRSYWTVGLHGHGGLAESVVIPASCALGLAQSGLSPDLAALAQPMAIAVHATRRGRVDADDRVTVIGAGWIGSFVIAAAATTGAAVTAIDLDSERLATAYRLGATRGLDFSDLGRDPTLDQDRPTVVFECTGRPEALIRALDQVADRGRVVVVGHQPDRVEADFRQVALDELEIIGTQAHVFSTDFPAALDLIAADPAAWAGVAPTVYPLDQVVEVGLIPMAKGKAPQIKVLFDPSIELPRPFQIE